MQLLRAQEKAIGAKGHRVPLFVYAKLGAMPHTHTLTKRSHSVVLVVVVYGGVSQCR